MNKPTSMIIKETKMKLAKVCNESGLELAVLDLILQGIYSEVHTLANEQSFNEEMAYATSLKKKDEENKNKENFVEE